MKYFVNLAVLSRRELDSLEAEVYKLKRALKQAEEKNAQLQAKLDAYEIGCLYGGEHCKACGKSRQVSIFDCICTLNVPCKEFVPKEAAP